MNNSLSQPDVLLTNTDHLSLSTDCQHLSLFNTLDDKHSATVFCCDINEKQVSLPICNARLLIKISDSLIR